MSCRPATSSSAQHCQGNNAIGRLQFNCLHRTFISVSEHHVYAQGG